MAAFFSSTLPWLTSFHPRTQPHRTR
jgi:hypothetical protein